MKISILTLFPKMFSGPFDESIVKRAIEKKLIDIEFVDIRNFGIGAHKLVDDTPYGGGVGMVLRADVLKKAIDSVIDDNYSKNERKIILTSATGKKFNQNIAREYSNLKHLIIICGHYEGVDERIKKYIDDEISIGDYVLTGGEIPAMVITDSVSRLVTGVLKEDATIKESFTKNLLEHPQYTKPQVFEGKDVPKVLLSGNHQEIEKWRDDQAAKTTQKVRPDLIKEE